MTRPIKQIISPGERFARLLVWHPINTDPADDDRWTVRVWLPLYDVLVILAGYVAWVVGSPLLSRLFPAWVVDASGILFLTAGVVTFLGVIIPKLWRVEIGGKIAISFLFTTYALLVLTFPTQEGQNNSFVTVILIMATWGIYPRLTKLFIRGFHASQRRKATARWAPSK